MGSGRVCNDNNEGPETDKRDKTKLEIVMDWDLDWTILGSEELKKKKFTITVIIVESADGGKKSRAHYPTANHQCRMTSPAFEEGLLGKNPIITISIPTQRSKGNRINQIRSLASERMCIYNCSLQVCLPVFIRSFQYAMQLAHSTNPFCPLQIKTWSSLTR
jgi:hypothetical protein